jgi:hypothetical protein
MFWWTCPFCCDRMATSHDPRDPERDRDAHLRERHAGAHIEARLLWISHWPAAAGHRVSV